MSATMTKPAMTIEQMVERYVKLRDKKLDLKQQHTAQLKPYDDMLELIEGHLLSIMNNTKCESMRTNAGTAYKATHTSAKVTDWPATLGFIREHEAWDLLEARVAKNAAEAIVQETKAAIPGVEITTEVVCQVRRASADQGK